MIAESEEIILNKKYFSVYLYSLYILGLSIQSVYFQSIYTYKEYLLVCLLHFFIAGFNKQSKYYCKNNIQGKIMHISELNPGAYQTLSESSVARFSAVSAGQTKAVAAETKKPADEAPYSSWQKNILLSAIEKLENNHQMDNSHPLSKADNVPIETFEEALIELSYFKTNIFRDDAGTAQANLHPENVVSLFTEAY